MNLIKTSLMAVAMAAMAAPAFAADADVFDAFRQVCGDTAADYPAVVTAAETSGWKAADLLADPMKGVTITDKTTRTKGVGDTGLSLFAWRGTAKDNVKVSACTIRMDKATMAGLEAAARTWAGFDPQSPDAAKNVFQFTQNATGRVAVAAGGFDAAAAGAGMEILTVKADSKGGTLDLLTIKK